MTKRRVGRLFAVVSVIVVGAALLTGCSSAANSSPDQAASTARPKAGQCWTTTFASIQKSEDWQGAAAVSCAKTHQTYTYSVATMAVKFTYKSWLKGNTIRTDVDEAAYSACQAQQSRMLPGITTKEALLYPSYYLPSTTLWAAGARWVRCDVAEIKVGSTIAAPQLTNLPSFTDLVATLKANPEKFALCEDDGSSTGPDGDGTTYADCTGPSDLTFLGSLTMAGAVGETYPGLAALTATGATQCATFQASDGHAIIPEPPLESNWTNLDDRTLDCWQNNN